MFFLCRSGTARGIFQQFLWYALNLLTCSIELPVHHRLFRRKDILPMQACGVNRNSTNVSLRSVMEPVVPPKLKFNASDLPDLTCGVVIVTESQHNGTCI